MNVLEYEYNRKGKRFFNVMYQRNLVLAFNKSTRIGRNIDFETAILKTDVTDHFPVVKVQKLSIRTTVTMMKKISKLSINDYLWSIGMDWKTAMIAVRLINGFSIFLTQFMTYISKKFSKIKNKAYSESVDNKRGC